jgi:two-component system phosphate regulon sensor histidine kinase PhoR
MRAFRRTVERLAASRRRGVFRLVVEWGAGSRETDEGVVVRDSFGGEARGGERFAPPGGSPGRGGVAEGRLRAPFSFVVVRAVLSRPDAIAETGRNQSRLFAWGIALLGGGVGLGSLVVFRLAAQEIRRARARSDFVLGVSHDLRTPLASMRVLAESLYLDRVQAEEQRKRFLGTIVRESDRLGQLIERVLFLVRFGQGSLACRLKPVSLDTLLEAAIQSVRARFAVEDAGVRVPVIQQNFDPSAVWVLADEAALTQVFWNLLDNAVKYSLCISGGEPARTTVTVRSYTIRRRRSWWRTERRWIVISVADRGLGIEKRDLRRVFRPYFRSPAAVDANISGVGLGLTVCRHVVALHGGWMEVSSRLGEGSEFRAILPLHHEVGPCAVLAGEETPSGKRPVRDGSLGRETTA